jgi:outer membrane biosynthesis protein TonB
MFGILFDMFASLMGFTPFLEHEKAHLLIRKLFSILFIISILLFSAATFGIVKFFYVKSHIEKLNAEVETLKSDNLTMLAMLKTPKAEEVAPRQEQEKVEVEEPKTDKEITTVKNNQVQKKQRKKSVNKQKNANKKSQKKSVSKSKKKTSKKSTKKSRR